MQTEEPERKGCCYLKIADRHSARREPEAGVSDPKLETNKVLTGHGLAQAILLRTLKRVLLANNGRKITRAPANRTEAGTPAKSARGFGKCRLVLVTVIHSGFLMMMSQ
jgi:hypothetical protein